MHWDALGAIAELLGALGVIASLFYVASQIRRNSSALEASTNQAVADSTQQRLLAPAQNPTLAAALANSRNDFDALTPTELVQLAFFSRATFRGIRNAFFQPGTGPLGPTCQNAYYGWCGKRRLKLLSAIEGRIPEILGKLAADIEISPTEVAAYALYAWASNGSVAGCLSAPKRDARNGDCRRSVV